MDTLTGSHQIPLVALSIFIAIFASYTALDLGSRITASNGIARRIWLVCGAIAMGTGIWSMHFVGMEGFHLPMEVSFNVVVVILSMLPALVASGLALYLVSRPVFGTRQLILGGLLMGTGVVTMHYTGMAAMRMDADIQYDPLLWTLSYLIAIGASCAALYLLFAFRGEQERRLGIRKILSSVAMGFAIAGMHYTGMAAASYHPTHAGHIVHTGPTMGNTSLAYAIGLATLVILGFVLVTAFIDRRLADKSSRLQYSESRYRSLFEHNPDAVVTVDLRGYFVEVNPAAEKLLGVKAAELFERTFLPFVVPDDVERVLYHYDKVLNGHPQNMEATITHRDGHLIDLNVTGVPVLTEDKITGVYIIAQDITERKRTEQAVNYMAYHDDLTGLPNRRLFVDRLSQALKAADRNGSMVAILFLDLDRFKNYNDSLGHMFGDELLQETAVRLQSCLPAGATLARLGGDEFTVLLPRIRHTDDAMNLSQQILALFEQSFLLQGYEIRISTSIGVAVYPNDGADVTSLMRNADTAMYRAKEQGNHYQLYNPSMDPHAYEKMLLETELRKALDRQEFVVHYQPQINMKTMRVEGVEALVRWIHPERGMVSPAQFIPLAEETGLIVPIGEQVLRMACKQNKAWQEAGMSPLRVSVNLSLRQFQNEGLVETVANVLEETGLDPKYLELEITESMTMNVDQALRMMYGLKQLGVSIGMDDFGTGYSSLSYLKKFPIDRLKIDQSFVRDIRQDPNDASIVTTIISMAHNLKLKVVAEGVETADHVSFLLEQACDEAQGYFFARPLSAKDLEEKLRDLEAIALE